MVDEEIVRYVRECESLIDSGYTEFPIMHRSRAISVYGALAAFDSFIISQRMVFEANNGAPLGVGQIQYFKTLGEGLVWSLRWILNSDHLVDVQPLPDGELISQGAKLLIYGSKYFSVCVMYSQFSREMMVATIDPPNRLIRFDYAPGVHHSGSSWGIHDEVSNANSRRISINPDYLSSIYKACRRAISRIPHHYESGRIILDDLNAISGQEIGKWCDHLCREMHSYPESTDVVGFTLFHYNKFWRALIGWSVALSELYIAAAFRGTPQETCMPTQVMARSTFVSHMAKLSGLEPEIVEAIVERLTFDYRTEKPDIYLQPLVCGENSVSWSAAIVQLTRFQRNLLKLMAKTRATKDSAAGIIGEREGELIANLRAILEAKGWSTVSNKKIRSGADRAEIDLLAVNWAHPTEVLVIEAKAFLHADDINEIRSATVEMQRAQSQVSRVIEILRTMPISDKRAYFPNVEWEKVGHWYALVVTPETEPGINFDHSNIPAASLGTMRNRITSANWGSPYRIWKVLVNREWQSFLREPVFRYEKIRLAGITFEVPFIKLPEDDTPKMSSKALRSTRQRKFDKS